MNPKKIVVVGGGAAGCMAAGTAAKEGAQVLLLERNDKLARKILVTGKGRCNVTNQLDNLQELIANVPGNGRFLYSAFTDFMPQDMRDFLAAHGVPTKVERGNRVFPQSDKAMDVVDALAAFVEENNVQRKTERAVKLLKADGKVVGVACESGNVYEADAVIVTTGGKSYPRTGSTGDGYQMAEDIGHKIMPLRPSLSALKCREGFCTDCMGLSLRNVALSVVDTKKKKEIYKDFGEMLFTHFGVSGPMILSASAHLRDMAPERYKLYINLKPALSEAQLDARILRDFEEESNKNIYNALGHLLPRSIITPVLKFAGIRPNEKANQITKEARHSLLKTIQALPLTVLDFYKLEEAIVTAGGVKTSEVNPKTMESKLLSGLYFAGEILDVDAYTGGFNLQIAFSTGHLAGSSAAQAEAIH